MMNGLPWHDAELVDLQVNRFKDRLRISVCWPDDDEGCITVIQFVQCYLLKCNFNFAVAPPDHILVATYSETSPLLEEFKSVWNGLIDLSSLKNFSIHTNSSNSSIEILATGFSILSQRNAE
ncbi:MAG: hypothetical protein Q8K75_01645 [Chlamydiales bacterium]|nr:hypothetical protein [Chlamydiales bacterium]